MHTVMTRFRATPSRAIPSELWSPRRLGEALCNLESCEWTAIFMPRVGEHVAQKKAMNGSNDSLTSTLMASYAVLSTTITTSGTDFPISGT